MGDCIYCGNPAGFLRKKHPECEQKYTEGWTQMVDYSRDTALGVKPLDSLVPTITKVASTSFVPPERIREAMTRGWSQAVSKFLEDNILQEDEEHKLVEFMNRFKFDQQSLDADGSYTKVVKAGTLRDIMDGRLPRRIKMDSSLPFNFQKDETPVWAFTTVRYFEDKVRREYVGGYQGVSVRVAKGLYYRTGGFRGEPVEHTERIHVDTGVLAVTDKHLYFAGAVKSFRVPFKKIVSFQPFSDAVGVMRDAANAKLQTFVTGDGWFTYNLLTNLSSR